MERKVYAASECRGSVLIGSAHLPRRSFVALESPQVLADRLHEDGAGIKPIQDIAAPRPDLSPSLRVVLTMPGELGMRDRLRVTFQNGARRSGP